MQITRDNYSYYSNLIQQMSGNKKKTGGKMNAACMFWDSKGNKTLSYNPESRNWKAISTDEEFARARQFTSIYNDELARLKKEYGEPYHFSRFSLI